MPFENKDSLPYGMSKTGYWSHDAMEKSIEKSSRILDVGCATGYFMVRLSRTKGSNCVGIESNKSAAHIARQFGFQVLEYDIDDGFANVDNIGKFRHIIFGDVLEHTKKPSQILESAKELLDDDGSIIVSLPNIVSLAIRVKILLGKWRYTETGILDASHLRFFSVITGREFILDAGYWIESEDFVGPLSFKFGENGRRIINLWPNLLCNQMIFKIKPKV